MKVRAILINTRIGLLPDLLPKEGIFPNCQSGESLLVGTKDLYLLKHMEHEGKSRSREEPPVPMTALIHKPKNLHPPTPSQCSQLDTLTVLTHTREDLPSTMTIGVPYLSPNYWNSPCSGTN